MWHNFYTCSLFVGSFQSWVTDRIVIKSCRKVVFDTNLWPLLVWRSDCYRECLCVRSSVICVRCNVLYRLNYRCSKKFSNMVVWLFEDQWNIINFFFPGSHVFIIIVTIDLHVFYFDRKSFVRIVNQYFIEYMYINWQKKMPFKLLL